MHENPISKEIVDAVYKIHTTLGPGLLESVYEVVLTHELKKRGFRVERQVPVPIEYDGIKFEEGFRPDLLVEDKVIAEIKSIEEITNVHRNTATYLLTIERHKTRPTSQLQRRSNPQGHHSHRKWSRRRSLNTSAYSLRLGAFARETY
jgi:GxxExxY protein